MSAAIWERDLISVEEVPATAAAAAASSGLGCLFVEYRVGGVRLGTL